MKVSRLRRGAKARPRVAVAEICTSDKSNLSIACKKAKIKYQSFGVHNRVDLTTKKGKNIVKTACKRQKTSLAVMSPRCTYFSTLQNANRRTSQQRKTLSENRRKDQPMFTNTYDLALDFVNDSTCVLAEQPKSASSWRRTDWR